MSLIPYLTRIHFAEHVLEDALRAEIGRLGAARPLIVADRDGRDGDGPACLETALPAFCAPLWCPDTAPDAQTDAALVDTHRRLYREQGCDMVLCFGGARAMQIGRRVAAPGPGRAPLPLLAVPTTAADIGLGPGQPGLGEGLARVATPDAILCDPTLTHAAGPERTAAHGFDVLTHCLEAFLGRGYNPPADGIALEGVYRAARFLQRAVSDGTDAEARREVMAAALNAGLASQKGLGGAEAMCRAIEAECGIVRSHGLAHAPVLPVLLAFNARAVGDRYSRIAAAMGMPASCDLAEALSRLAGALGLPERIGILGLPRDALRKVAERAAIHPAAQTNPRHATPREYLTLLESAY